MQKKPERQTQFSNRTKKVFVRLLMSLLLMTNLQEDRPHNSWMSQTQVKLKVTCVS